MRDISGKRESKIMARINLGREKGPTPTGSAQFGGVSSAGYGQLIRGYERLQAANDSVARGISHVSNELFKAYEDQASIRNRQEILEGRTAQFEFASEQNRIIEERLNNGEFDGRDGLEKFKKAVMEGHAKASDDFNTWAEKNVTRIDTRNALLEDFKLDTKRNFAYMSGRFLAHDRKRRWEMLQRQTDNAVENGNYENGKIAIEIYSEGKSPELKKQLLDDYSTRFCNKRLDIAKGKISLCATEDEVLRVAASVYGSEHYYGANKNNRELFDAFVFNAQDAAASREERAKSASQEAKRKADKDEAYDFVKGVKATVSAGARIAAEAGEKLSKEKINEAREKLKTEMDASSIPDGEKKALLEEFNKFALQIQSKTSETVNKICYNNVVDTLKTAIEQNDGDIDIMKLAGKNAKVAASIADGRKLNERVAESREYLADRISKGILTEEEAKEAFEYRESYFNSLTNILKYDSELDPRGEKLAGLIVDASKFDAKSRKQFLSAIYNKVVKGEQYPTKWNSADVKEFDESFAAICEYNKDTWDWWQYDDTNDPVAFSRMRDRVLNWAKIRGLSPAEVAEEMKKDPFFQKILLKRSMREARENYLD